MSCGKKSKIKIKKSLKIQDPVLGLGIYVEFTRKYNNDGACAHTFLPNDIQYSPSVYFDLEKPLNVMIITHELLHALRHELTTRRTFGFIDRAEDEILPYYIEYFFDKIVDFCNKNNIKIGIK